MEIVQQRVAAVRVVVSAIDMGFSSIILCEFFKNMAYFFSAA